MEEPKQIKGVSEDAKENIAERLGLTEEGVSADICLRSEAACGSSVVPSQTLYIVNPTASENRKPDCYKVGLKGYGVPHQHPLYSTSNSVYGRHAPPPGLNKKRFPRRAKFTTDLYKCGIYEDFHLTTEVETDVVYRQTFDV
ncbi:UPF0691 protein [Biomphalaria pfeifferi]|uniref:UPF0691 protein n=1 Tax=Biomphalaria pfeifferi TaxID=112525 RepID=A0AAD8BD43_BIOPF|nr:UPF0691 protein [Biomphalaria pfeifferi]